MPRGAKAIIGEGGREGKLEGGAGGDGGGVLESVEQQPRRSRAQQLQQFRHDRKVCPGRELPQLEKGVHGLG